MQALQDNAEDGAISSLMPEDVNKLLYVGEATPPPAPTPPPPPGSWQISGSGCVQVGDCISSKNYPYLSNSTYSLPRNHKLYKTNSTRRYAPSFRESQESLLRNSSDVFYPESRETLLNRYPGSGRNTPGQSPHTS